MALKKITVTICQNKCKGCELCVANCPKKILFMSSTFNRLGYKYAQSTNESCTGCASCFYACPEPGTITITEEKDPS